MTDDTTQIDTTTMTDEDVLRTHHHAEMIKRPHLWTWTTTLPLEHNSMRDPQTGMLLVGYIRSDNLTRVYLGNIFTRSSDDPIIDYASPESIVAGGWRVE